MKPYSEACDQNRHLITLDVSHDPWPKISVDAIFSQRCNYFVITL